MAFRDFMKGSFGAAKRGVQAAPMAMGMATSDAVDAYSGTAKAGAKIVRDNFPTGFDAYKAVKDKHEAKADDHAFDQAFESVAKGGVDFDSLTHLLQDKRVQNALEITGDQSSLAEDRQRFADAVLAQFIKPTDNFKDINYRKMDQNALNGELDLLRNATSFDEVRAALENKTIISTLVLSVDYMRNQWRNYLIDKMLEISQQAPEPDPTQTDPNGSTGGGPAEPTLRITQTSSDVITHHHIELENVEDAARYQFLRRSAEEIADFMKDIKITLSPERRLAYFTQSYTIVDPHGTTQHVPLIDALNDIIYQPTLSDVVIDDGTELSMADGSALAPDLVAYNAMRPQVKEQARKYDLFAETEHDLDYLVGQDPSTPSSLNYAGEQEGTDETDDPTMVGKVSKITRPGYWVFGDNNMAQVMQKIGYNVYEAKTVAPLGGDQPGSTKETAVALEITDSRYAEAVDNIVDYWELGTTLENLQTNNDYKEGDTIVYGEDEISEYVKFLDGTYMWVRVKTHDVLAKVSYLEATSIDDEYIFHPSKAKNPINTVVSNPVSAVATSPSVTVGASPPVPPAPPPPPDAVLELRKDRIAEILHEPLTIDGIATTDIKSNTVLGVRIKGTGIAEGGTYQADVEWEGHTVEFSNIAVSGTLEDGYTLVLGGCQLPKFPSNVRELTLFVQSMDTGESAVRKLKVK